MDTTYNNVETPMSSPAVTTARQRSPWHSPVPYLFGGLAAMLGLIAFALLVLACSYWNFSRWRNGSGDDRGEDQKESSLAVQKSVGVLEEKVVVVMAGDDKPTYIATPVYVKTISCGISSANKETDDDAVDANKEECSEKKDEHAIDIPLPSGPEEGESGMSETRAEDGNH